MLNAYKKKYHKNNFQYILVDNLGCVIETDHAIVPIKKDEVLQNSHPFFEILSDLLLLENESFEFSCVNLNFDDEFLIVDVCVHLLTNNENLVIIEDLTKHYNNYQLTAQKRNESIIHSQILELKNEYLLEKETFKNNFIANFSHQLRNPITASIIFSDLLIDSNISDEHKNYLKIIQSSNKDLKNRIEDILDISKIESGKLILVDTVFNLIELINNISDEYKFIIEKKELTFNLEIGEKIPEFITGDQYRLKQIIGNLLNNALANTSTGNITLSLKLNYKRANKAIIRIEVLDTGCGIAEEHKASIFDRFTKIESKNQTIEGVGLGLAIVKYLVTEMQGSIKVESELHKGSKFTADLSFIISDYNQKQKKELLGKQSPNLDTKHHILLLEDSELIQVTILKTLASTGLFYIDIISKGEDLIPNILNQNVDLILLSNTIQDFPAMQLATSIRNLSKEYKKTPIIALSTQAYKQDIKHFKKSGINDVLVKPFNKEKLLESILKHLK